MVLLRRGGDTPPWHPFLHQRIPIRRSQGTQKEFFSHFTCKPALHDVDDDDPQILCKDGDLQTLCTHSGPQIHGYSTTLFSHGDPPTLCKSDPEHEKHIQILCSYGDLDSAVGALSCVHVPASTDTYLALLKACNRCKSLAHLTSVRAHLAHHYTELNGFLGDYLVLTLATCGAISDALQVCRTLPHRTVFSWTAIISAYAQCSCGKEALDMFQCMQDDGVKPNSYTFVSLFKACGSIADLAQGKRLHAMADDRGFTSNLYVGNTLVSMYG
eukprot:c12380_g2_i1 orf=107-919(+)